MLPRPRSASSTARQRSRSSSGRRCWGWPFRCPATAGSGSSSPRQSGCSRLVVPSERELGVPAGLEIPPRKGGERGRDDEREVGKGPDTDRPAVDVAASEWSELEEEARRPVVSREMRRRPSWYSPSNGSAQEAIVDACRICVSSSSACPIVPEQACHETGAEEHEDGDPVRGRREHDRAEQRDGDHDQRRRAPARAPGATIAVGPPVARSGRRSRARRSRTRATYAAQTAAAARKRDRSSVDRPTAGRRAVAGGRARRRPDTTPSVRKTARTTPRKSVANIDSPSRKAPANVRESTSTSLGGMISSSCPSDEVRRAEARRGRGRRRSAARTTAKTFRRSASRSAYRTMTATDAQRSRRPPLRGRRPRASTRATRTP